MNKPGVSTKQTQNLFINFIFCQNLVILSSGYKQIYRKTLKSKIQKHLSKKDVFCNILKLIGNLEAKYFYFTNNPLGDTVDRPCVSCPNKTIQVSMPRSKSSL